MNIYQTKKSWKNAFLHKTNKTISNPLPALSTNPPISVQPETTAFPRWFSIFMTLSHEMESPIGNSTFSELFTPYFTYIPRPTRNVVSNTSLKFVLESIMPFN